MTRWPTLPDMRGCPAAEAWFARGEAQRGLGHEELARDAYEQAAAYALSEPGDNPASDAAILPLALDRLGNSDGARKALEGLLSKMPDNGSLLCVQAMLAANDGAAGNAIALLERAVTSDPHQVLITLTDEALADFVAEARFQNLRERAERERSQRVEQLRAAN
jgi:predicted Zn-dependent protease